jgi:hypothetical protein
MLGLLQAVHNTGLQTCARGANIMNKERKQSGPAEKPADNVYASFEPNFVPSGYNVSDLKETPASRKERRRHHRIASRNGKACILCNGEQQIVEMLNVSRGGICIRSRIRYAVGTFVQVAAHYVEGANNIFLSGRVVRANLAATSTLPGEYGIEILRTENHR